MSVKSDTVARPTASSIHLEKARTLQAIIDELRTILNLKRGDSLIEAVKQLAALKANQKQPFVLTQEILTDLQNKYQDRGYCEDLVHEVIQLATQSPPETPFTNHPLKGAPTMFTAIFNHTNPTAAAAFKSPVIAQAADTADHVAQAALPAAIQSLQTASIIATTLFSALAPNTQPQASTSSQVSE